MAGESFHYIGQAARIADQLDSHIAADGGQGRTGTEGRGSAATEGKAPIRIDVASALDEHDRDILQELAIRKAARESIEGDAPDVAFPDRTAGAALLEQMLGDGRDPAPLAARTVSAFRRHLTVLACVLAEVEGHARMRCPRAHAPAEGMPGRTVVPGVLLDGRNSLLVCMHPECDETPGVPRALNVVDEVLLNDPERLVTIEEVALFLGISEAAAKARIRRARNAGYDLPVVDQRVSGKGQTQNQHRLADLVKVNSIGRDLGTGMPDWPEPRRRRGRPTA